MARPRQLVVFALLCGASIPLWWHSIALTLRFALGNDACTHILLIVPLSLALIYLQWRLHPQSFEASTTGGLVLLAGALLIAGFARGAVPGLADDLRLSMSLFALVTWWIASVVYCLGVRALWSFLFPLFFLYWMVPIPSAALNWIIPFLQNGSSSAARLMFRMAGVPVI